MATTVPAPAERVELLEREWKGSPGLYGWLTTTDHKRVGLLYFWATLAFFFAMYPPLDVWCGYRNRFNARSASSSISFSFIELRRAATIWLCSWSAFFA